MIDIKIGTDEQSCSKLSEIHPHWLRSRFRHLQSQQSAKCIRIRINTNNVKLVLATDACPGGEGSARRLNQQEQHIANMWMDQGFHKEIRHEDGLVAFCAKLAEMI